MWSRRCQCRACPTTLRRVTPQLQVKSAFWREKGDVSRKPEKFCRNCGAWSEKIFCCVECKEEFQAAKLSTPERRHAVLVRSLHEEKVPHTDMLWNLDFYSALIGSGECTYCRGPLAKSGHGLDKILNSLGHRGFNVCSCCSLCNRIKSDDDFSFEEMAQTIGPAIAKVRRERMHEEFASKE